MKFKSFYLQVFPICIAAMSLAKLSHAQSNALTYEVGVQYFGLKGNNALGKGIANGGVSPTLGITYRIEGAKLPLSIGFRANLFSIQTDQHLQIPVFMESLSYQYSFQHNLSFLQFQMPIAYHFDFKQSDLFVGLSPTLYWNTKASFDWQVEAIPQNNLNTFSKATTYEHPETLSANIDLSVGYNYFFPTKGKRQFGLQAKLYYPLLKMQSIYSNYTHEIEAKNGDKETFSASTRSNFTPYTFGISFLIR